MTKHSAAKTSRRLTLPAIAGGVVGSVAIAASMGASLSGLTASITNSTNTSSSSTLAVQETSGLAQCNSYDSTTTCDTINKYGGTTLAPGASKTTTVSFKNAGQTAIGTSTLVPTACSASSAGVTGSTTPTTPNSSAGNLCSVLQVAVYKGADSSTTALYSGSLSGFTTTQNLGALAVNATQAYTFVVTLPGTATTAVQGQSVNQPLTWNFNQ